MYAIKVSEMYVHNHGTAHISPCDPNVMLFHPLVSKIWARTDQNGTFSDNNWPPS